jgi:tetratricopeptide (TPR) repeat protein
VSGDVFRWPRSKNPATGAIRFGPPEPVISVPGTEARALSSDGRTLVLADRSEGSLILHRGRLGGVDRLIPTGAQHDVRKGAVSSNGRWVASGTHWNKPGKSARVWDAATGRLVKKLALDGPCAVGFSPDSRWLVTGGGGTRLWRAGTWDVGPRVLVEGDGEGWAFSPDGRLLALGGHGRVRLVRPDTGAEVARLALREQTKFEPMCFTPDGGELLVQGEDTEAVHVWDLRLIRRQLVKLRLDWDDPALPEPASNQEPTRKQGADALRAPPKVEFVGADLVADVQKMRQYRMAYSLLALRANPFDAGAHFRLGQLIGDSNPAAAYAHYTFSLMFQPDQPIAYENRAVAAYRLKRWHQVIADCGKVLEQHPDRAICLSFRAGAYQWLGRNTEAVADLSALLRSDFPEMANYDRRARCYEALGQKARAKADRRRAGEVAPDDARQLNARAWRMLAGAESQRDFPAALKLAQRAVRLAPAEAHYANTLGIAQYRNGLIREAKSSLEGSRALGNGNADAFDLFFLAMCHQKLGETARACDCFHRAQLWWRQQKNLDPRVAKELEEFQAEAAALKTSTSGGGK